MHGFDMRRFNRLGLDPDLAWDRVILSVVIPCYNEVSTVESLLRRVREVPLRMEVIVVDDGSTDGTRAGVLDARRRHPELGIRLVALDRNWGLTAAMDAGFRAARGQVVATLDTDLQNDPADLPRLLDHLSEADVAIGIRINRRDPFVKRMSSKIANGIRNRVTREDIVDTGCSLKVYRKDYLDRVKLFTGLHRFLPTLLKLEGARVVQVPVNHRPRVHGQAKYHLWNRLVGPLLDLFAVRWMQRRHLGYRTEEIA